MLGLVPKQSENPTTHTDLEEAARLLLGKTYRDEKARPMLNIVAVTQKPRNGLITGTTEASGEIAFGQPPLRDERFGETDQTSSPD